MIELGETRRQDAGAPRVHASFNFDSTRVIRS
jgi:hypothetical protein